jgi:hypothetical protein
MHYFILAASKNKAQLFEVTGDRIAPFDVDGMPASMADAWNGMEREDGGHIQFNANDATEQEEDKFMHDLAKSLHDLMHGQRDPLVFAGVAEAHGMFKKFDQSGRLLDEFIKGNQDETTMEDLKAKADPIVRADMLKKNEAVLEQFGALHGTGRTSIDPVEIAAQANAGKVETLILPEGKTGEHQAVAKEVWKHRGSVVIVESAHMPEGAPLAAILRL